MLTQKSGVQLDDWHIDVAALKSSRDKASNEYLLAINAQQRSDWEWLNGNRVGLFNKYAFGTNHSIWFFNQEIVGRISWNDLSYENLDFHSIKHPYAQRINIAKLLRRKDDPVRHEKRSSVNEKGKQVTKWRSHVYMKNLK